MGQTLGSFKVVSLLGEGGMGRVYLAEHVLIGRRAAIKVLAAEIADKEDLVSRFFTEARAVNDIRHPNIVEVTDFGTFGNQPYIVMELLDGETLEQRLDRVRMLDLASAARVVAQVAAAVGAGHEHGMVHRDLKPANIFLRNHPDYPDFVKVLDFGIAKLVARDSNVHHHTEVGALIGTPAYMSPEQCLGDTHLDHHSDIYSLGVVLFQMVTGRLPFTAETAGRLIMCHVQEIPPAPQSLNPNVPIAVSAVILRAMAKKPEQRFASMREFREAILTVAPAAFAVQATPQATLDSIAPLVTPPPVTMPPRPLPANTVSTAPTTYSPSQSSQPALPALHTRAFVPAAQAQPASIAPRAPVVSSTPAASPLPALVAQPSVLQAPAPSQPPGAAMTSAGLRSDFAAPQPTTHGSGKTALVERLVELVNARTAPDADLDLPLLPRSILRCLDLLSAPDFSFGGMATFLSSDARLGGQILQVANTCGPVRTPARSTEQAIARLGTEGVRTGLFEIALRPLLESNNPRVQAVCKQPWQHALAVAIASQRLMQAHGGNERAVLEAYRCGLFHDAGKPLAANLLFDIEKQMTHLKGRRVITEEMLAACLDRGHAPASARLARAWGLSPESATAIEEAAQPPRPGFSLGAVVRLANALAFKGGFHTRRDELDRSRLLVDEARRAAGFDEKTCHRVAEGLKDAVSRRL